MPTSEQPAKSDYVLDKKLCKIHIGKTGVKGYRTGAGETGEPKYSLAVCTQRKKAAASV